MQKPRKSPALSTRQLWGVAIISSLLIIGVVCWRMMPTTVEDNLPTNHEIVAWSQDQQSKESNENTRYPRSESTYESGEKEHFPKAVEKSLNKLFPFDPNTVSLEQLITLGLRPKVAQTILNYRNKGGKFRKKEDLAKIYTLNENDYKRLAPYIQIKEEKTQYDNALTKTGTHKENNEFAKKTDVQVYVNTCTPEQLMALRGIGTGYANRIIKYRDILGGYHDIDQLKEVYGMTDSLFFVIKSKLIIDKNEVKKININDANEETLYKHPYIRKMAKHIVAYRKELGGFKALEDFKQVPLINEEIYRKIVPYLTLSNL